MAVWSSAERVWSAFAMIVCVCMWRQPKEGSPDFRDDSVVMGQCGVCQRDGCGRRDRWVCTNEVACGTGNTNITRDRARALWHHKHQGDEL